MTKQSGLGDNLWIDGYDLSGDTQSLSRIGGGPGVLEMTGIDKSAYERVGTLRDGVISLTSFWNVVTGAGHDVWSDLPRTDRVVTYARGTGIGSPAACLVGKQINYDPNRGADGSLLMPVEAMSNAYGLEWGEQATAGGKRTDTTATNGASLDLGAASSFGLQAYLHVFSFIGTSVTVKLQGSSDNGVGDAFADITGGAFAAATGRTSQRIATASNLAIERYIRVVTTGTFSSATFAVVVVQNEIATVF